MLTIITGPVNSGKTSLLLSLYQSRAQGDGFVLTKQLVEGQYAGQRIMHLKTGRSKPFCATDGFIPDIWQEGARYQNHSFSSEGLAFADRIFANIQKNKISPVFVDEIGPLELKKEGFYSPFSSLLARKWQAEIYTVVRDACLIDFLQLFAVRDYTVISLSA